MRIRDVYWVMRVECQLEETMAVAVVTVRSRAIYSGSFLSKKSFLDGEFDGSTAGDL